MGILSCWHGRRAVILACGMVWFGPAADLWAGTPDRAGTPEVIGRSAEPFGLSASVLSAGALREKWRSLARQLDDDAVQLALCDGDRERCVSPAALQLLAIVDAARARDGRARLGEINRAINLAIRPVSDLAQYGEIDVWSSPLVTFAHGAGDCEDYAIAKFVALRLAGVAASDLRIVIMRDTLRGEDHAVAAARLDGHWLTLDNRRMAMVEDAQVRNYRPTFVIDQTGIMQYVDAPLLAGLPGADPAPANLAPGESCCDGSCLADGVECAARPDLAFQLNVSVFDRIGITSMAHFVRGPIALMIGPISGAGN